MKKIAFLLNVWMFIGLCGCAAGQTQTPASGAAAAAAGDTSASGGAQPSGEAATGGDMSAPGEEKPSDEAQPADEPQAPDGAEEIPKQPITVASASEAVPMGTAFADPFVEGSLYYTVDDCQIYDNLAAAGIAPEDMCDPHNLYSSSELGQQYQEISDYISADQTVVDTHRLVVMEMTIDNESALGLIKKSEFNLSDISLYGGTPVNRYNAAYFSEAGKADPTQPLHYILAQGETMKVRVAYLVLAGDVDSLVGMIHETTFGIDH